MQAVDSVLDAAVDEGLVPGVVAAIITPDACIYSKAAGFSDWEAKRPIETDAIFRIASMTKLVTSVAVMLLVDDGKVDLDAPLSAYVPGFRQPEVLVEFDADSGRYATRPAARDASLRELLSHTGGYGYWWLDEPLRIASGNDPDPIDPPFLIAEPGSGFHYSTSADVIGLLFEPLTGMTLDRFFERRIFAPLDMADTGYRLPREPARLVAMHRRRGDGYRALPQEAHGFPVRGGGGLYSTAADYSRLLRCLLGNGVLNGVRLLSPGAANEIGRNQIGAHLALVQRTALADRSNDFVFLDGTQKFGFGVMIETQQQPRKRSAGAYGWGGIANTYFWVDPGRALAATLMMQIAPFASRASIEMLDRFEQAVYSDWNG